MVEYAWGGQAWCAEYGITDYNGEGKANEMCCTCGGGSRAAPSSSGCPKQGTCEGTGRWEALAAEAVR